MGDAVKDIDRAYNIGQNVASNANKLIVDTAQENATGADENDEDVEVDVYEEEVGGFYMEMLEQKPNFRDKRDHQIRRKNQRMDKIMDGISAEKVDLVELGKSVIVGTSDKTLNQTSVEKAVRTGVAEASFLGDISMEALVDGMMDPAAADGRYAMLGTSVMWNALKTNMRDLKSWIVEQTAQSYTEPRFDIIDLHTSNIPNLPRSYNIHHVGVFANADLKYVFTMLNFRKSAKLLNKTKQFLKAYFIMACIPRCMIWRYTVRRSGNSHKKAILNLPFRIVQTIISFLIDLTGLGNADKPFEEIDRTTPFYHSLGEDESLRELRYYEACKLKDQLTTFFREAITDVLNEIREMPFCLNTGTMITPLRGRNQGSSYVMWRDYEGFLKREHDLPSKSNIEKRVKFEQKLMEVAPRSHCVGRR